jgi:hypothetical protein
MLPQLDLREEASHLKRFNHDFSGDDRVSFPEPILTTPKVLMETFLHGSPILSYLHAPEDQRKELAKLGLQTVLKMIFLHDFVHGDLHPGNILVENTGSFLKMHLLDCGLVIEMGPEQHVNVVKVLGAFTRKDGVLAGQLMVDNAAKKQASDLDVQLFVEGIEQIVLEDVNHVCVLWEGSCCSLSFGANPCFSSRSKRIRFYRILWKRWGTTLPTFVTWPAGTRSNWNHPLSTRRLPLKLWKGTLCVDAGAGEQFGCDQYSL